MPFEHDSFEDQMRQQSVDTLLLGKPPYDHVEFGIANQVPQLMFHSLLFTGVYWAFEEKDYNLRLLAQADELYGPDFSSWSDWLAYSYTLRYGQRRGAFRLAFENIGAEDLVDLFIQVYDRATLGNGYAEYEEGALRWRYVLNDLDRIGVVEVEASGMGDLPKGTWYEENDPQNLEALGEHLRIIETMKLVATVYTELLDAAFDPAGVVLRGLGRTASIIGGLRMYFAARKGRPVRQLADAPTTMTKYGERARATLNPPPQRLVKTKPKGVPPTGEDMGRVRVIDGPRRDAMIIDGDTFEILHDPNVPVVRSKAVNPATEARVLSERGVNGNKVLAAAPPLRQIATAPPTILATIPGRYRNYRFTVEIIDSPNVYKGVESIRARITFSKGSFPSDRADEIKDVIEKRYTALNDEIAMYIDTDGMPPVVLPPGTQPRPRSAGFKSGHAEDIPGHFANVDEPLSRSLDGITHDANQRLMSADINGFLGDADTRITTWVRNAWRNAGHEVPDDLPGTIAIEGIEATFQ